MCRGVWWGRLQQPVWGARSQCHLWASRQDCGFGLCVVHHVSNRLLLRVVRGGERGGGESCAATRSSRRFVTRLACSNLRMSCGGGGGVLKMVANDS